MIAMLRLSSSFSSCSLFIFHFLRVNYYVCFFIKFIFLQMKGKMNEEVNHLTISFLPCSFSYSPCYYISLWNKSAIKNNLWDKCRRIFLLIDIEALSFQFSLFPLLYHHYIYYYYFRITSHHT